MNAIAINVELANTNAKRTYGLMHRSSLDEDSGMLFMFDNDADHKFWNKNVNFPLSLGFFNSDGVLLSVKNMEAQSPIGVSAGRSDIKYVLEVNKGFFDRHDIKIGSTIDGLEKDLDEKKEKSSSINKILYDKTYYILNIKNHEVR